MPQPAAKGPFAGEKRFSATY
eukprot:SAG11_NODE_34554_length_271_cov_0.843023_1_plen_20_part_10